MIERSKPLQPVTTRHRHHLQTFSLSVISTLQVNLVITTIHLPYHLTHQNHLSSLCCLRSDEISSRAFWISSVPWQLCKKIRQKPGRVWMLRMPRLVVSMLIVRQHPLFLHLSTLTHSSQPLILSPHHHLNLYHKTIYPRLVLILPSSILFSSLTVPILLSVSPLLLFNIMILPTPSLLFPPPLSMPFV